MSARGVARESDRRVEWVRSAVALHERPLTQYAVHLLAGDLERARDLVQEAFLRLCDQDQDAIEGHVVEWLYTVCRNLAIDVKRKERRMRLITDEQQDSFAATYESPTDAAEREDSFGRVTEVIQNLPPRQQEIVRLKFQHGMSYKEIGKVMNLTATNVGFILHTAIKSLREHLDVRESQ
ncbi:RNA polymerase sigma factor [Humisphaera borealis]|uniref:Sigma-70 family RNA polymerase sigma factor n=1 Tax=Humisphaera borealis TaxID=2807512 RepID=A0A7M2X2F1_9BACT|nr:sigma-70 family RNA polymerase sigma factor [Humisphaera borealis]QOV91602.1 sigma-70 family RNA polymerase sigma factor [Humisphaera borealis]